MAVILGAGINGIQDPVANAGAPVNGTDEVQTVTIGGTPTGGTFTLTFDGHKTGPITWSATTNTLVANIDAALEALGNIGASGVVTANSTLSGGIGDVTVTFSGTNLGKKAQALMTADASGLTGTTPTVSVAETTAGVDATHRGAPKGTLLIDTTNAKLYMNTGTAQAPTWTPVALGTKQSDIADMTITYTTGSGPTANGAITIANAATPTVAELLEFCVELNTKLNLVLDALDAYGMTA